MISESMKINTTLTTLNLVRDIKKHEKERRKERKKETERKAKKNKSNTDGTDNNIVSEGAGMISEALKINTTLTKLNIAGDI